MVPAGMNGAVCYDGRLPEKFDESTALAEF
jgi:hypothetical protein